MSSKFLGVAQNRCHLWKTKNQRLNGGVKSQEHTAFPLQIRSRSHHNPQLRSPTLGSPAILINLCFDTQVLKNPKQISSECPIFESFIHSLSDTC
ncbi:hypothetical protein ACLB2K_029412 [Fragaria x ananassa]